MNEQANRIAEVDLASVSAQTTGQAVHSAVRAHTVSRYRLQVRSGLFGDFTQFYQCPAVDGAGRPVQSEAARLDRGKCLKGQID